MNDSKYKGQRAISYLRASAGKGRGQDDSTDRQGDLAVDYCNRKQMVLDTSFSLVDEGVSAYRRVKVTHKDGSAEYVAKNLAKGGLAEFYRLAQEGAFPNGVNLVVEKLDRVYRDKPTDALRHFLNLLAEGVTIHTVMDDYIYDPNSDNDQELLLISVVRLCASHEYSKALSQRQILSRTRRLERIRNNEVYWKPMGKSPDWVETIIDGDERLPFISDTNRELIKYIFSLYGDKGLSSSQIAIKLNRKGITNFKGNMWQSDSLLILLRHRAVMGKINIHHGEEKYYPELHIIDDSTFAKVQSIKSKVRSLGRTSRDYHIFGELLQCGYCLTPKRRKGRTLKPSEDNKDFVQSRLYYCKNNYSNRNLPLTLTAPNKCYRCRQVGECSDGAIDYYKIYDSFFAFIKELDFGTLIDEDETIDTTVHQNRIIELKASVEQTEKDIKRDTKLFERFGDMDDDDLFNEFADKVKAHKDKKKELEKELVFEKELLNNTISEKKNFLRNEKEIKKLLNNAHNDYEYWATEKRRLDLSARAEKKGKYKNYEITKEEKDTLNELFKINDYRKLYSKLRNLSRTEDKKQELKKCLEEWDAIRYKYFSDEIKKDEDALQIKQSLRAELSKFIKSVTVFQYGFTNLEPTKPSMYREQGSLSSLEVHRRHLDDWMHTNLPNHHKTFEYDERRKKWTKKDAMKVLGIGSNTTWSRWAYAKTNPMPNPTRGAKMEDAIKWVKEKDKKSAHGNNRLTLKKHIEHKKFFGFAVEFTDICRKDIIKYVIPHYNNASSGISLDFNIKNSKIVFNSNFGAKEIKMKRPAKKLKSDDNTLYVSDDPIYAKSLELAMNAYGASFLRGYSFGTSALQDKDFGLLNLSDEEVEKLARENIEKMIKELEEESKVLNLSDEELRVANETIKKWKKRLKDNDI